MSLSLQRSHLGDWTDLLRHQAFVAGRWIDAASGARFDVRNPATGAVVASVPDLGTLEMHQAIAAAQDALRKWSRLLPRQRSDALMNWYELMLAHRNSLAALMTVEQGKPKADAVGEIQYGANFVRWFAEEANRAYGEVIPSHLADSKMFVQREALGVVGLITPWNFPSAMLTRKAAAALAAGCTVVAVPSPETPLSALALASLAEEAGIPPGVFSVLTGKTPLLPMELCRSQIVRGVSFTGSTQVGRQIAAQCAPTVKRLSLELGGHAPFIVFADVSVGEVAAAAAAAKFQTSGQDCLAANRIFVHRKIYEPFLDAFVRIARAIKVGEGFEPHVEIGPLINSAAVTKSEQHVADAVAKGARVLAGGHRHPKGDLFFEPTVLADVTPDMKIMQEETFGPVAAVTSFEDEAQVIAAANATEYGLVAYLFTRDVARVHRVGDALEYGMVAVNTVKLTGAPIPFGGIKQSGFGREGSRHGLDEYTVLKYVCMGL